MNVSILPSARRLSVCPRTLAVLAFGGMAVAEVVGEPAQRLIELEPGMRWTYAASGSITPPGAATAIPLAGEILIHIEAVPGNNDELALHFKESLAPSLPPAPPGSPAGGGAAGARPQPGEAPASTAMAAPGGAAPPVGGPSLFGGDKPAENVFYFQQDDISGAVHFVADTQGPGGSRREALQRDRVFIPGGWSLDTGYRNRIDWEGGGWTENFLVVEGVDTIETGAGAVPSWRAPNGSDDSSGMQVRGTDWWAPPLGQPSRFEAVTTTADGVEIRLEAVLESTNVEGWR